MVLGTLLRKVLEGSMAGSFKLTVRHVDRSLLGITKVKVKLLEKKQAEVGAKMNVQHSMT